MSPLRMFLGYCVQFVRWVAFHTRDSHELLQEAYCNLQTIVDQPAFRNDETVRHYRNQTILPASEPTDETGLAGRLEGLESAFEQSEFLSRMADDALYCRQALSEHHSPQHQALVERTLAIVEFLLRHRDLPLKARPGRRIVLGKPVWVNQLSSLRG